MVTLDFRDCKTEQDVYDVIIKNGEAMANSRKLIKLVLN